MSQLRVVWPEASELECDETPPCEPNEPDVLSFEAHSAILRRRHQFDAVRRARRIHRNARCPECDAAWVISFEMATSAAIAFHCERCRAQWSA